METLLKKAGSQKARLSRCSRRATPLCRSPSCAASTALAMPRITSEVQIFGCASVRVAAIMRARSRERQAQAHVRGPCAGEHSDQGRSKPKVLTPPARHEVGSSSCCKPASRLLVPVRLLACRRRRTTRD